MYVDTVLDNAVYSVGSGGLPDGQRQDSDVLGWGWGVQVSRTPSRIRADPFPQSGTMWLHVPHLAPGGSPGRWGQ